MIEEQTGMHLSEVARLLEAETPNRQRDLGVMVKCAFGADLMSDVLSFVQPGTLLLTGLTNLQVIRTCEVAGVDAIVFVRGKRPTPETERLAEEAGITLLYTKLTLFEACGRLFAAGLRACELPQKPAG